MTSGLELDKAMRASLARLDGHPELALSVGAELVALGFGGRSAWALVEGMVKAYEQRRLDKATAVEVESSHGQKVASARRRPLRRA